MKRKQIYLAEPQEDAVRRIAEGRGVSEAHVIREAIEAYIADFEALTDGENPLLALAGVIDDPGISSDASLNVDEVIYGVPKPRR